MKEQSKSIKKRSHLNGGMLKVVSLDKVNEGYSPIIEKPVRIRAVKDAKRLLSKLIYEFQIGRLSSQPAKDLTYMLINYVNICTQVEFEERLQKLESETK